MQHAVTWNEFLKKSMMGMGPQKEHCVALKLYKLLEFLIISHVIFIWKMRGEGGNMMTHCW